MTTFQVINDFTLQLNISSASDFIEVLKIGSLSDHSHDRFEDIYGYADVSLISLSKFVL